MAGTNDPPSDLANEINNASETSDHASNDTIVAIATAHGRGGIGVVRLSGPRAVAVAEPMLRLRRPPAAGRARFAEVLDLTAGEPSVLDEAVVTYFAAPHSYTSEDVVEIALHGAPVLLAAVVRAAIAQGARLARPGEFTERAFLSGRLDLTQAEAVEDLVSATTLEQARTAARQLGGALSREVSPAKQQLIALIAGLEAGIDFAEDDLELMAEPEIAAQMAAIETPLRSLAESFRYGRVLREGFRLGLVGQPNVGKSSLFNRLIERDRAIVTAEPGTTRDPVEERMELAGIPFELVDTAGLRATDNEAEALGVAKSHETIAEADLVLLVVAADQPLGATDLALLEDAERTRAAKLILVVNKIDLATQPSPAERSLPEALRGQLVLVETSALTQQGLPLLRQAIREAVGSTPPSADTATVTNLRQHQAIEASLTALAAAQRAAAARMPHEMLLLDLYEALSALDQLTGTTTPDDVLELIFSRFCIGK